MKSVGITKEVWEKLWKLRFKMGKRSLNDVIEELINENRKNDKV